MPFKRFDEARPLTTLAIIGGLWLLLPVGVKSLLRVSFFEFTAPISVAASHVRDLQDYWSLRLHSQHELIEAGAEVGRLNASYQIALQKQPELEAELARLEQLLRLPSFPDFRYEHARVARRDFSAWWQRLVIRKGKNFGIPVNAPVIFTGGVVGRVIEVYATTAVVELISSPGVRLSAYIEGDTRQVSFQGGTNTTLGAPIGVVEIVPLDIMAMPGAPKRLVTSGLGVFPPGLALGQITKLDLADDGLFKTGEVRLDERLAALSEVTVLVPLAER